MELQGIQKALEDIASELKKLNENINKHEPAIPQEMMKAITMTNLKKTGLYEDVMKEMLND